MDQESLRCMQLISQSTLAELQIKELTKLVEQIGKNGKHQILMIKTDTLKEKLKLINKYNKYRTFNQTFQSFKIVCVEEQQTKQNYVIVIQEKEANGLDEIKKYRMQQLNNKKVQISSIKQQFNIIFSSYIDFLDQFKDDGLQYFCIHKIQSVPQGEFRISVIDRECLVCTNNRQQNIIKSVQAELIVEIAKTYNEVQKELYQKGQLIEQQDQNQQVLDEKFWNLKELQNQQVIAFQNSPQQLLLFDECVNSAVEQKEDSQYNIFIGQLKAKFEKTPYQFRDKIIKQQIQQFSEGEMKQFVDQIKKNTNVQSSKYHLVFLLIIQNIHLKYLQVEQKEKAMLECFQPYLRIQNYENGLYKFHQSFNMSIEMLDEVIEKLQAL